MNPENTTNNNNSQRQGLLGRALSGVQAASNLLTGQQSFQDTAVGNLMQSIQAAQQNRPQGFIGRVVSGIQETRQAQNQKYPSISPMISQMMAYQEGERPTVSIPFLDPNKLVKTPELLETQKNIQQFFHTELVRALPRAVARFTIDAHNVFAGEDKKIDELRGSGNIDSIILSGIFGAPNDLGFGHEHLQKPLTGVVGFGREILGPEVGIGTAFVAGSIFNGFDMVPGGSSVRKGGTEIVRKAGSRLITLNQKTLTDYGVEIAKTTNRRRLGEIVDDIFGNLPKAKRERTINHLVTQSNPEVITKDLMAQFHRSVKLTNPNSIQGLSPFVKKNIKLVQDDFSKTFKALKKPLTDAEVFQGSLFIDTLESLPAITRSDTKNKLSKVTSIITKKINPAFSSGTLTKTQQAGIIKELEAVASISTDAARTLRYNAIGRYGNDNVKAIYELMKMSEDITDIARKLEKIDITDKRQLQQLIRNEIKPTLGEMFREFRYINMLSSPKTQIINAVGNFIQATITKPLLTDLPNAAIDPVVSLLTGKQRQIYLKEIPIYYRSIFSSMPKLGSFLKRGMSGNLFLSRPDVSRTLTETLKPATTRVGRAAQSLYYATPRFMEAMDQFAQFSLREAEVNARMFRFNRNLGKRGGVPDESFIRAREMFMRGADVDQVASELINTPFYNEIYKPSVDAAQKLIFRAPFDTQMGPNNQSGQGAFFTYLDRLASAATDVTSKVPLLSWFAPFIRTPSQIFKQGVELTPFGFFTMIGARNKQEQFAKAFAGTTLFTFLTMSLDSNNITGPYPRDQRERQAQIDAGIPPWSIRVGGNNWVSINRIGPIAFPMGMAIATRQAMDDPRNRGLNNWDKLAKAGGGTMQFFISQNYMRGIQEIFDLISGRANFGRAAGGIANQFVPMSGLLNWIRTIEDDVIRDTSGDSFGEEFAARILNRIPGLSRTLPARVSGQTGLAIRNRGNLQNAFFPGDFSVSTPELERVLRLEIEGQFARAQRRGLLDQREAVAEQIFQNMILQDDISFMREYLLIKAINPDIARRIERMRLGSQRTTEDEIYLSIPIADGSRAVFLKTQLLDRMPNEETRLMKIQELINKKVITEAVLRQLILLYSQ